MDPDLLGAILLVPYYYVPADYDACNGKSLPVKGNERLFGLIGTQFGGEGTKEFALPNIAGSEPLQGLTYVITTTEPPVG